MQQLNKILFTHQHGKIEYQRIPWDSDYLQNQTIEILAIETKDNLQKVIFDEFLSDIAFQKGDLLYFKLPLSAFSQVTNLYKIGFYWIEESVLLKIFLPSFTPEVIKLEHKTDYKLALATKKDIAAISSIAQTTFVADRYHLDPNIPNHRADYRYQMWIKNSFSGKDEIYAFTDLNNQLHGFFIIERQQQNTQLRLAGLDPHSQGKGIGKLLYYKMYEMLKLQGVESLEAIISLNNLPVLNVYMYLGQAKFVDPQIVLHYTG